MEQADAFVIMVGGMGTLDEATEILELKKHGRTGKPVVLLNTAGFYDGLREQLHRMQEEASSQSLWPSWCSSPTNPPTRSPSWKTPSRVPDPTPTACGRRRRRCTAGLR